MVRIDPNWKPPPRKKCKNPECNKLEIIYGYCGFCYAKEIDKAHEAAKNSKLEFK